MKNFDTTWSDEEFKAYLFLYCASADFVVTGEEKDFIRSRVNEDEYNRILSEFNKDNDYQRIQKINAAIRRFEYSEDQLEEVFESIKKLFLADGKMDTLEQNIYRGLKHLLK